MKYTNISVQEMRDFLKAEKRWKETVAGNELVFSYALANYPFILIKVFTGIKSNDLVSRGCGKDAIRVCAVNIRTNQGWIKSARVYRVEGWKNNLKERVQGVIHQAIGRCKN